MSRKSNDRDDSKRPRESSLDDSNANATNANVFTESLKSEDCVAILHSCMKQLEEEMKKVLHMCEKTKDSQVKGGSQLISLCEAMDFMTNTFEEYGRERQEKDKIIGSMKSDMVNMSERIEKLEKIVDRQEQYSRRNCLLLHGIAVGERENTDDLVLETLNDKSHVDLTLSDLDRTQRIGQKKASSNKPRAVIIKYVSYNTRKRIFLNKKRLKGTQVSITESLTAKTMEAREKHQFRNVWTAGNIVQRWKRK